MKKEYRVVAGIIVFGTKVLIGKRGPGFFESKWEFPGGKIEPGESETEALTREIREEIGCNVVHRVPFASVEAEYEEFSIHMATYLISSDRTSPVPNVHQELIWEEVEKLSGYDWCDADWKIVELVMEKGLGELHRLLDAEN